MEKANKFFFLENVNDNVNCDFNRQGEKTMLVFCHENDSEQTDRLTVPPFWHSVHQAPDRRGNFYW
ncbi:hypothetical protein M5a_00015 [Klebsiella phage VLCpiM5a]|nr:hypothetical protein M5a_00015 [Klebsiella phage VLCpiM5a]